MIKFIFKTAFQNLGTKKLFTAASICTIACSVFIFCIFFSVVTNIRTFINTIETTIGIQVFFDEDLNENQIKQIANRDFLTDDVKSMRYISSNEAWEYFKKEYFDNREDLAKAFEGDNPLANSSSYEILLYNISKQEEYVSYIKTIKGVRQVNYSSSLINVLTNINLGISYFSFVLMFILIIIAIILISNTIAVASQYRKNECEIMKLIGATNFMIRSPFVIGGLLMGFFGSIIPLSIIYFLYNYIVNIVVEKTHLILSILRPVSIESFIFDMASISLGVSMFVCGFVSYITINRHTDV